MLTNNTEDKLIKGVMIHGPDILEKCLADSKEIDHYLSILENERLDYPKPLSEINPKHWYIPNDYYPNLVEFLYGMCNTAEQTDRVSQELTLFIENNMMEMLFCMKYVVDTLRANNVVWGVGRGSSVASYVLHLIGVHKIDSIKYNIPIDEFFKGEQNG
jgi:DNA polymerase III alpha subunit